MRLLGFLLVFIVSLSSSVVSAKTLPYPASSAMNVGDTPTSVPVGWINFCKRYAGECESSGKMSQVRLTPAAWSRIVRINKLVNAAVKPISDMDHWGVEDQWDYPLDGKGDCEDYALLKRKLLVEAGFPASALLMTVVTTVTTVKGENRLEGHAILTVVTDKGDYLLDNINHAVVPWTWAYYNFRKRQSSEGQLHWLEIVHKDDPIASLLRQ